MYSLVSAPVLGFDLARLEGGSAVAEVLLRGLSLTESDLDILAGARLDDWDRIPLWQDVEEAARQRQTVREAAGEQGADLTSTLTMLEGAPIGTVDGLLHCVRHDVLDWTWQPTETAVEQAETASQATAVLCDAVVAAYLRDLLPITSRRRLAAGWLAAARWLPPRQPDLGPQSASVTGVLSRVRTLRPAERARLTRAATANRQVAAEWAAAVHSASWAVYVSGRVRAASAAQLMLVQAVEDAGVPVADRAAGVWNLLSGTVQALVVRDALDADTVHRLLEPYLAAMGPSGLE
jgi:hypothetical protein